jgi:hypothetical protein
MAALVDEEVAGHQDVDEMASRDPTTARELKNSATIGSTIAGKGNPFPSLPGSRALTSSANNGTRILTRLKRIYNF